MRRLIRRGSGLKVLDVIAGGERIAHTAQQHDAHRGVLIGPMKCVHDGGIHRPGQGVLLLRPVEQDFQHRTGLRDENVAHWIFPHI